MGRLSFFFIFLLAIACKKDRSDDEQNENLHEVNFKISGFSTSVLPLNSISLKSSGAAVDNYVEGYLYFWSFNAQSLEPDIAFQKVTKPSIVHDGAADSNPFVAGYSFEEFPAGQSYSIKGAKEVVIKMPIGGVHQITQFAFDTGSSGTGPKDFELYYSIDEGVTFKQLSLTNQFSSSSDYSRQSRVYPLTDLDIKGESIWFKAIPKAGDRGTAGNYNTTTGTWRFDNIRLVGLSATTAPETGNTINKLHYFLFHKDNSEVVVSGTATFQEASDLTLQVPVGNYHVCFISNNSSKELIFPESLTATSFYVGNTFSNYAADIFGYVGEIDVSKAIEQRISLKRLYSQVKLEFTDEVDLSMIKRIVISQQHDPLYFAPFNTKMTNPILDQSDIVLTSDLNANKQVIFNQFLGMKDVDEPLKFQVMLYGDQHIIRTLQLQSALKNNMQLVFRGYALESQNLSGKFHIQKSLDWDDVRDDTF